MNDANSTAIMWFRQDLRICDNPALTLSSQYEQVVPVFIYDTSCGRQLGAAKKWWLHQALAQLGSKIENFGNTLVTRTGDTEQILDELIQQTGAKALFWNRRYDPSTLQLDAQLKQKYSDRGLFVKSCAGFLMHEPTELMNKSGTPFKVFTPFWKTLQTKIPDERPLPAITQLPSPSGPIQSVALTDLDLLPPDTQNDWATPFLSHHTPGEDGAKDILARFVDKNVAQYGTDRDFPALDATSKLSPHLTFGEISPRQIWHASMYSSNSEPFRRQLGWRDFSYYLLMHNPDLATKNFNPKFDRFVWQDQPDDFKKWTKGLTGYPIVDAGMRQLWQTGYMHNRVRMIVASFLTKHLLIDWRLGEQWFWDTLLDADPANNPAGWQWVAGSGADASPYYRIFNPVIQGKKFDPDGHYVRTYVPELSGLSNTYLHTPWDAPDDVLSLASVALGATYPHPIIAHDFARKRALDAYEQLKDAV